MVEVGTKVANFEVPMAKGESGGDEYRIEDTIRVGTFSLEEALDDGPVVLAFLPGVYTPVCRDEVVQFRDSLREFDELNVDLYGVSVDSPFPQNMFINQYDVGFPLLSDHDERLIEEFDVVCDDLTDLAQFGYEYDGPLRVAQRSVFAIDRNGEVAYAWRSDSPLGLPDLDEVKRAVEEIA